MLSGSTAGHGHAWHRQLPVGPGGVGEPKPMMLKMPPEQSAGMGSASSDGCGKRSPSAQVCAGLSAWQDQARGGK